MNTNKAKLKFYPNRFEVIEEGEYVLCAVSGKKIPLKSNTDEAISKAKMCNYKNLTIRQWK